MGAVIDIARRFGDSLTNLVTRMGTPADKAAHGVYGLTLLSDMEIMNAYRGAWLPRKIVDIPAMDSCRKWRNWQAEQDQIETIEAEENRLNVRGKVLEARIKARLWGGSAILIGTGDVNLMEPLNVERLGLAGLRYLTVFTRRQLTAGETDRDPTSEFYGKPLSYTVRGNNGLSMQVHPSRLAVFQGNAAADDELAAQQGWGDSVLVSVLNAIKNADSTAGNIASLVFEAKVDIIRSPNFMASLADPEYADRWLKRFSLANMAKGVNGVLMLDKDEEYESKSTSFATLPDILDRFLQIVSGAADIPATRLLGQSPAGLASTGESDLRNYYDRISAMQEIEMTPAMHRMDEAIIRSALGSRPPEVHYIWSSLWQISDKERADIGKIDAETIKALNETGLFPPEALASAGANMLVEHSIMPGLQEAIDEAGGLPDYDMEAEAEAERERLRLEAANANAQPPELRLAANDAAPRTLYVRRDVLNAGDIERWAKSQGFTDIVPDLHVTIAYSRQPVDWFAVGTSYSEKLDIPAGGPRQMERLGDGKYIALLITASELVWRHREIVENGASWDWPDYQPHISIQIGGDIDLATVEPYQGKIVLGPEMFEEVKL